MALRYQFSGIRGLRASDLSRDTRRQPRFRHGGANFFDVAEEGSGSWTTERRHGEASWLEGLQENFECRSQQGPTPSQQHHAPVVSKRRGGSYVDGDGGTRHEAETESNGVRQTPVLDD
jgi:hypothetical protein